MTNKELREHMEFITTEFIIKELREQNEFILKELMD